MVKAYKTAEGKWRARVALGGGKYKSFTRDTKKEAMAAAMEFEVELPEVVDEYCDLTLREAMERYIDAKRNLLSPSTVRGYASLLKTAFLDLQGVRLYELTQEKIQVAVNLAAADVSPKTVRNMYGLLSSTLKMYLPGRTLNITLPKRQKKEIEIPTEAEVVALLREVAGRDIEVPILLAAMHGLRRSEICGLRWEAVSLDMGLLRVEAAKVMDEDNNAVMKGTKTTAGYRTVKLLPSVVEVLRRHYDPAAEFVTALSPRAVYAQYERAFGRVTNKHYTFHALRHFAVSTMLYSGVEEKYISRSMGHEGPAMVREVYGHIMQDKTAAMFSPWERYAEGVLQVAGDKVAK